MFLTQTRTNSRRFANAKFRVCCACNNQLAGYSGPQSRPASTAPRRGLGRAEEDAELVAPRRSGFAPHARRLQNYLGVNFRSAKLTLDSVSS